MWPTVAVVGAYLLGAIPFGYLVVWALEGSDVRETGSGGTGATNVSRRAGKVAGIITLVLDALKGVAAVLLASNLLRPMASSAELSWWVGAAAVAVIVGHIFPVWLKFRGGKGVATAIGVFIVLSPWSLLVAGVVFLLTVLLTRYVSLGSLLGTITVPLSIGLLNLQSSLSIEHRPLLVTSMIISALIILAHRGNIVRLRLGTESKFR